MANEAANNPLYGTGNQLSTPWKEPLLVGVPSAKFHERWVGPFNQEMAKRSQDKFSMTETMAGVDDGAPNNPLMAAPNRVDIAKHTGRKRLLFGMIMQTIDPHSMLYRECEDEFDGEGILLHAYIVLVHTKENSMAEEVAKEGEWAIMSQVTLAIATNENTIYNMLNALRKIALDFNTPKTIAQQYMAFLRVLPKSLSMKVTDELNSPSANFVCPAVYPAGHPLAGNAHPNAGQKDLRKIATFFSNYWTVLIQNGEIKIEEANAATSSPAVEEAHWAKGGKGKGKGKGKGFGRGKGYASPTSPSGGRGGRRLTPKSRLPITNKTCCYRCGGLGHLAVCDSEEGPKIYCPSAQIDKAILSHMTYGTHITNIHGPTAHEAEEMEAEEPESDEDADMVARQFANMASTRDDASAYSDDF